MIIELMLVFGMVAGLAVGLAFARPRVGCSILLIIPVAMLFYVAWWQSGHPADLRSTSGLDYLFGPLWPSLGALVGYYFGKWLKALTQKL
jgi:hypothetical protein